MASIAYNIEQITNFDVQDLPTIKNVIEEIPINKINKLIDNFNLIIDNSTTNKTKILNEKNINKFIKINTKLILKSIKKLNKK